MTRASSAEIQKGFDHDAAVGRALGVDAVTEQPAGLLRQVELRHFGSHTHTRLRFDQPVTFIVGAINAGKTSIPEAIEWAITGRNARGVDGGGRGAEALVLDGQQAMRVGVELAQVGWVKRGFEHGKLKFAVNDVGTDPKLQQAQLYERLRTNEAFVHAVFNAYAFLDMPHAEAKGFVLQLLDVKVKVGDKAFTLEQLESRYQTAFDNRRAKKAQRQALRIPIQPDEAEISQEAVTDIEARLAELRQQEKTRLSDGAETRGRRRTLEASLDELTRQQQTVEKRLADYGDPHGELDKIEAGLQELERTMPGADEVERAQETDFGILENITARLVDDRGYLKTITDTITAIDAHNPAAGCVLNAEIPCKTPAKMFTGRLDAVRKKVEELEGSIATAVKEKADVDTRIAARIAAQLSTSAQRDALERQRRRFDAIVRDQQTDQDRLQEINQQLTKVAADIEECGEVGIDPELDQVQARIEKGDQVIKSARSLAQRWTEYRQASASAETLNKELERVEQEVDLLGPNGARVQAIAGALSAFLERINCALSQFGYELGIDIDPWRIVVNGRSAVRLSTSERLRVGMCLQLALAELTGLQLAVFDNTEWLVGAEVRATFASLVMGWATAQPGRQVIVIASKEADWESPNVPGVAVYRCTMADGVSTVTLEREGAAVAA